MSPASPAFPVRDGAEPCEYYLKTGKCNYGPRCKFSHPPRGAALVSALNRRDCFDFVRTGSCPYGRSCKYNHPASTANIAVDIPPKVNSPTPEAPSEAVPETPSPKHTPVTPEDVDDPIALLRRGSPVLQWRPRTLSPAAGVSASTGFNPLVYDAPLFGRDFRAKLLRGA